MDEIITLRIKPYQESTVIMTAFSRECGLIQIFSSLRGKIEPLSLAKVSMRQKGRSFFYLNESSLIDPYLPLRSDIKKLEAAAAMMRIIEKSQVEGRKSKELFLLLTTYLSILKLFTNPKALSYSFALKVLEFEGLINKSMAIKKEPLVKNLIEAQKFEPLLHIEISNTQEVVLRAIIDKALLALT
jgi:DNA repair protein RecO